MRKRRGRTARALASGVVGVADPPWPGRVALQRCSRIVLPGRLPATEDASHGGRRLSQADAPVAPLEFVDDAKAHFGGRAWATIRFVACGAREGDSETGDKGGEAPHWKNLAV